MVKFIELENLEEFRDDLREELPSWYATFVRPFSKTLAQGIKIRTRVRKSFLSVQLFFGYYWAGVLDQGHGGIDGSKTRNGRYLIWFPNRSHDPRRFTRNLRNRRKAQERKLTPAEYRFGLMKNREYAEQGREDKYMVVVPYVGPMKGAGFVKKAQGPVVREAQQIADRYFKKGADLGLNRLAFKIDLRMRP